MNEFRVERRVETVDGKVVSDKLSMVKGNHFSSIISLPFTHLDYVIKQLQDLKERNNDV